jgi:hypothetical protein
LGSLLDTDLKQEIVVNDYLGEELERVEQGSPGGAGVFLLGDIAGWRMTLKVFRNWLDGE